MEAFRLALPDNATLTGIANFPLVSSPVSQNLPLIIGIHGAGYSSQYFDIEARHSAKKTSDELHVPFVAFDRPGYKGSTSIRGIPDGSTFSEENARWLHNSILPALWRQFGSRNGCTCMVLHCHSLGTPSAIIASTLHAKETQPEYPLGGIVFSGIGSQSHPDILAFRSRQQQGSLSSNETLRDLMLPSSTTDVEVLRIDEELRCHPPTGDIETATKVWGPRWRTEWAPNVLVCVMIGIAEADRIWIGSEEHLQDLTNAFTGSLRVEGTLLPYAPHNIEMSHWSQAWYDRTFEFAINCAKSFKPHQ
ncbi:Fc.00g055280.m01.CDS01 [Cosmosporella sp. VM-42]